MVEASHQLPIAAQWFRAVDVADGLTRYDEPHVAPLLRANFWQLRGRDRDLLVDTGCGIASLRDSGLPLFDRDPVVVLTHAHLDHAGGASEFPSVRVGPGEEFGSPMGSLIGEQMLALLGITQTEGLGPVPELLVNSLPDAGFDVGAFAPKPPTSWEVVADGAVIDLGDRAFSILHLPGHSPGSLCLFDEHDGTLFSGDVVYDDELLVELDGGSVRDYIRSLERLESLDVRAVHPGHDASFNGATLTGIIDRQLRTWGAR